MEIHDSETAPGSVPTETLHSAFLPSESFSKVTYYIPGDETSLSWLHLHFPNVFGCRFFFFALRLTNIPGRVLWECAVSHCPECLEQEAVASSLVCFRNAEMHLNSQVEAYGPEHSCPVLGRNSPVFPECLHEVDATAL